MKDLRKFTYKVLLYGIVVIGTVFFLGRFDNLVVKNNIDSIYAIKTSAKYPALDYLIIGNSYAYSDISCFPFDSMGLKYYNLGIPAASVYYYDILLNDYLSHATTPPKNILMVLTPLMFVDASDNWTTYTIHRNLLSPLTNEYVTKKYKIPVKDYISLTRKSATNGVENLFAKLLHKRYLPNAYCKDTRGYIIRKGETTVADTLNPPDAIWASIKDKHFLQDKADYLADLVVKLKGKGINVIFFEPPTIHTEKYFSADFLSSYEKCVEKIQAGGFHVIRKESFSNLVDLKNFTNVDHMNHVGAEPYTKGILNYILSNRYNK